VLAGAVLGFSTGPAAAAPTSGSGLKRIDRAALRRTIEATARELLVPGVVVLLRTPQGNLTITYGTTQLGTVRPPGADTYFRIASNTKTMTAAIVLQLAQEGKLKLQDPVSKYVARVPNGNHITIAELLEMRSGLYNYTDSPAIAAAVDRNPANLDAGGTAGNRVRASRQVSAGNVVRVLQYQLRVARPHYRAC
jgi:D-alanyl-D-alanine carboxypeptidase